MITIKAHPIKHVLRKINIDSCPKFCNFHIHTKHSDGSMSPKEVINQALDYQIKHIAITDHHTIDAYPIAKEHLKSNKSHNKEITLWTGIEITSLLDGCLVHILGLGFDYKNDHLTRYCQKVSATGKDLEANTVIECIHKSNGLAILAHPARYKKPYDRLISSAKDSNIDGIEVWYDYERSRIFKPSEFVCNSIYKYTEKHNLYSSCGTDSHGLSINRR